MLDNENKPLENNEIKNDNEVERVVEEEKVTSVDNIDPQNENVINQTIPENQPINPKVVTPNNNDFVYNEPSQSTATVNEVSFMPDDKKKKKKKNILVGFIAVLSVVAIAATSIIGYSLISGKGINISQTPESANRSDKSPTKTTQSSTLSEDDSDDADTKDTPTILQLSSPDDALTVQEIVKENKNSIVGISASSNTSTSTGTGIVMSDDGYIITNAHVVSGANTISVVFTDNDNETVTGKLVGIDSQTDLAVIKISKKGLTAATFGKSSNVQVGDAAVVIGNPLGFQLANSVTAGIISATDRKLTIEDREMNLLQTDASINSGNSGGALLNAYGQVIGVTSAKVNSAYGEGLGFAIPIDTATPIINDLIKYGYVKGRPVLGITGETISEMVARYYNVPQGFVIRSVESGSAADEAGIEVGDIVIGINDTTVTSITEFNNIKADYKAGDEITITLYRNNEKKEVKATLGEATSTATSHGTTSDDSESSSLNEYRSYGNGNGGSGLSDILGIFRNYNSSESSTVNS